MVFVMDNMTLISRRALFQGLVVNALAGIIVARSRSGAATEI